MLKKNENPTEILEHNGLLIQTIKGNWEAQLKNNILTIMCDYNNKTDIYLDNDFVMLHRESSVTDYPINQKLYFFIENGEWVRKTLRHRKVKEHLNRISPVFEKEYQLHTISFRRENQDSDEVDIKIQSLKEELQKRGYLLPEREYPYYFRFRSWDNNKDITYRNRGPLHTFFISDKQFEDFIDATVNSPLKDFSSVIEEKRIEAIITPPLHFTIHA